MLGLYIELGVVIGFDIGLHIGLDDGLHVARMHALGAFIPPPQT